MMMARSEGSQFIAIQHNATNSDPQTTGLRSEPSLKPDQTSGLGLAPHRHQSRRKIYIAKPLRVKRIISRGCRRSLVAVSLCSGDLGRIVGDHCGHACRYA